MGFWVASSSSAGAIQAGSEEQLVLAPSDVEYPTTPAGSIRETTGGTVVKSQPARDPRRRSWIWEFMPGTVVATRYIQLIHRLESLLSTSRRTRGLSPWIFLKDDTSDLFRVWRFDSGTATGVTSTTLTDSGKSWTTDIAQHGVVEVVSATLGAGQRRTVASNTATVLTLQDAWGTTPTGTVTYSLQYPESIYLRCRVLEVSKRVTKRTGRAWEQVRMEFVVDDNAHNALD